MFISGSFFITLCSIMLSDYTKTYFSILLLLDIGVTPSLELLNKAAINIIVQVFHGQNFSPLLGKYLRLELSGHKVDIYIA